MTALRQAFAFLTRLPAGPIYEGVDAGAVHARATRYYPLVGAVLALLGYAALFAGSWCFDRNVGVVLCVGLGALTTGALHLDGFADCIDGFAAAGNAQKRLTAMKDPRAGAVATVGVSLWVILKIALVARTLDTGTVAQALWCAAISARAPIAFELREGEPATPGTGLFAWLHGEVLRVDWVIALCFGAALMMPALAPLGTVFVRAMIGLIGGVLATLSWHLAWYRRVGGINGDIVGGAVEIREVLMLAAMGLNLG